MSDEMLPDAHLYCIDPALNMRRFYNLSIQPTLFGDVSLVRNWGRIGAKGQLMIQTFDESAKAGRALIQLEGVKWKRGYCEKSRRQATVRQLCLAVSAQWFAR